ncbi:MAG: DUF2157 domain-containing protein [Patescibacteria group bacterium]
MNKEEVLRVLAEKMTSGEISREEVLALSGQGATLTEKSRTPHFSLTKMFYVLGGLVVLLGIVFFVWQIWTDLGSGGRIIVTLGLGLVLAAIGSVLLKTKAESKLGEVFHTLAGLLIPGGALVTLNEIPVEIDSLWPVTAVFGVIFLFYLLLNAYHRREILTFFTIANGTAFIYLLVGSMIDNSTYEKFYEDIYAYLTMAVGLSYLLLAHSFRRGWNQHLAGLFNFVGAVGFFAAAFTRVDNSGWWQGLFFILAIGGLALAVYLKSRGILAASVLFLIIHFIYITREYFADSVGWPILLVILGFIFIGLGYLSITLNRKYLQS